MTQAHEPQPELQSDPQPQQPIPGITPRQWPADSAPTAPTPPAHTQPQDSVRVADFSFTPSPIRFTMDGETYHCRKVLPLGAYEDVMDMVSESNVANGTGVVSKNDLRTALDQVAAVFAIVLTDESIGRFKERLLGRDDPLDLKEQVVPAMHWVLEQYGLRPTEPSSDSSTGSDDGTTGITLTAGVQPAASTQPH